MSTAIAGAPEAEVLTGSRTTRDVAALPVLGLGDVATLLGLRSCKAARRFIVRQGVPHVRVGRKILVLRSSLLRWLRARETDGSAQSEPAARLAAIDRSMAVRRGAALDVLTRRT